ncbi:fimbrillin family protein (plasmid) [Segatella copri]|uniref:fimbrillin family protein n=1 Tax=Segatella copri TaxID=165179 RepID=UPI001C491B83|nr:fimbrillin family protein [Segatella copri]WOZ86499.1 fimbrillin family protein [Segatella copri]
MISVQADGQDAVTYQLNNNEWQPQGSKFLKWESETMNFTAYYPSLFNGTITQPTEYTSVESLAAADFMSFSGPQTNTNNSNNLTLTMERKMARVVVMIDGFKDQYAGANIDNVNSLSICGVKAFKHSDKKFYALIKPCEAQNSATFLSLDVAEGESKTTTETLAGIPALTAGNSYTYQLTVGKDKVSVSGIYVADWTTGDITGGKTEECPTPYITFKANGEQKFMMTITDDYTISGLQYSVNNGKWENVVANEEVTFGGANGDLRLRGTNINGTASEWSTYSTITFTDNNVNVACTGDIRTLLDWRNYNIVETNNARFCYLFKDCAVLTSAPELPATTLADFCYYSMFAGCTSLTAAPDLPAETLENSCYREMFWSCTNLASAPELPATTLANYCYDSMFRLCTKLTSAPKLPATTLADDCYSGMFGGCTSLTSAPELPAKKLAGYCYYEMFYGCTSLTSAPELPAKKLAGYCYYEMFYGCTSLTSAPELTATELATACYCNMFNGCENLSSVTMLAPSDKIKNTSSSFNYWLDGAGTKDGITRTLIVKDEAAYNALETNSDYLPANWKKDATNTTVKYYTPKQ